MHERVRRRELELDGHRVVFLQGEAVGAREVEQELPPGFDSGQVGPVQKAAVDQGRTTARHTQRPTRPFERLHVTQAARAFLDVGFEHLRDRAGTLAAAICGTGENGQDAGATARGELACFALQFDGDISCAGDDPDVEQRGQCIEIVVGECDRFLDRAGPVAGHEARVPKRVPELLRHRSHRVRAPTPAQLVHEEHVDVRSRAQLAARVRAQRHERHVARLAEVGERFDERGVDHVRERGAERAPASRQVGE